MTTGFRPSQAAQAVVSAWRALSWPGSHADLLTPWNQLVEAFDEDEAENLVYLALQAKGSDEPSYEAHSIASYARRKNEEREEAGGE